MLDVLKQAKHMAAAGGLGPDTLKASRLGRGIPASSPGCTNFKLNGSRNFGPSLGVFDKLALLKY
jgi:hypothetical protein